MEPIIKKERVRVAPEGSPAQRRRGHAKVVNLLRLEGRVHAIEFVCSCGETSVIELEYGEPDAPTPVPDAETSR